MKNPTRSLRRTVERAQIGAGAAARRLREVVAAFAEALSSLRKQNPTMAAELVAAIVHHLIMAAIERTTAWLLRRFATRPTGAQVLPFPALRPVP
jgi:hypothetical protein